MRCDFLKEKILAIDASGTACSVAVSDGGKIIGEIFADFKKDHSVSLMPAIDSLLVRLETNISEMDYIAATSGPGSFTGVRIGAATAKGLAYASGKKIIPVSSLDALASNISGEFVVPVMDARRGEVYCAFYCCENGNPKRKSDYFCEDIKVVIQKLKELGVHAVFTGDGVRAYNDIIKESGFSTAPPHFWAVRASAAAVCAALNISAAVSVDDFDITYIRKPQAEREYDARQSRDNSANGENLK
ncbi:MAG: tRNA (adenosine(37)-N6)-threonylcarbamoyltransferase complex dimerization subunit type 1 TsaB [Clostridiales bacterium]|jgi:tRNA threonylcarbamoyladenosine biosynthesis protein TsaB|nr:tRNA (adenosine(37)-N6)-threonylcarbamoyltransferase complex dimerization subunit type 1 TsaB [Clostridiales bacterium]